MKYYHLKDLTEVYYHINRDFLVNPEKVVSYIRGVQCFADDLFIHVDSHDLDINLNEVGFSPTSKWTHLVKSYVDGAEYALFLERIASSKGTSLQFRFRNRDGPNGPCLIAMVLTRSNAKKPWNAAKIMWRTAELHRKFSADLVLINRIFEEIPEEIKHLVQIEKYTLYLAQAFQSSRLVGPLIPRFCEIDEIDVDHPYPFRALQHYNEVYIAKDRPTLKFAPAQRMQRLYDRLQAGEIPEWSPEDVSLMEAIERQNIREAKK